MAMKKEAQEKLKAEQLRRAQAVVSSPRDDRVLWALNTTIIYWCTIYGMHCGGWKLQK